MHSVMEGARRSRRWRLASPVLLLGFVAGCMAGGQIGVPSQPAVGGDGEAADAPAPEVRFGEVGFRCDPDAPVRLGVTPIRRLNHFEYARSIEAALGASADAGGSFAPDPRVGGFDTAANVLTVTARQAEDCAAEAARIAAAHSGALAAALP